MHLCFNAAPAVVAGPVPLERPTQIFLYTECVVPGDGVCGAWLPWLGVLAWWNDRHRSAVSDSVVASARVVGSLPIS